MSLSAWSGKGSVEQGFDVRQVEPSDLDDDLGCDALTFDQDSLEDVLCIGPVGKHALPFCKLHHLLEPGRLWYASSWGAATLTDGRCRAEVARWSAGATAY